LGDLEALVVLALASTEYLRGQLLLPSATAHLVAWTAARQFVVMCQWQDSSRPV
jgi:hypothetical protein